LCWWRRRGPRALDQDSFGARPWGWAQSSRTAASSTSVWLTPSTFPPPRLLSHSGLAGSRPPPRAPGARLAQLWVHAHGAGPGAAALARAPGAGVGAVLGAGGARALLRDARHAAGAGGGGHTCCSVLFRVVQSCSHAAAMQQELEVGIILLTHYCHTVGGVLCGWSWGRGVWLDGQAHSCAVRAMQQGLGWGCEEGRGRAFLLRT